MTIHTLDMNIVGDFHRNVCISYKISYIYIYILITWLVDSYGGFELNSLREEQTILLSYKTLDYKSSSMFIDRYGFFVESTNIYTLLGL